MVEERVRARGQLYGLQGLAGLYAGAREKDPVPHTLPRRICELDLVRVGDTGWVTKKQSLRRILCAGYRLAPTWDKLSWRVGKGQAGQRRSRAAVRAQTATESPTWALPANLLHFTSIVTGHEPSVKMLTLGKAALGQPGGADS